MDLFPGNTDIEGATVFNACYGGTAALFNAFAWCESDGWDGRFAIVVAADIATYAIGPARPTSGAGAVALLVGRDAPLSFNPKEKVTYASNVWDFFKPDHNVEYPIVDGALSQTCYYQALEDVYSRFVHKMHNLTNEDFNAETPDYFVFHAPYNKMVQKSYGRLFLMDARHRMEKRCEEKKCDRDEEPLKDWLCTPLQETYVDKALEKILKNLSSNAFETRLSDANKASKMIGNTYAASIFFGLASLIDRVGRKEELNAGKSIVMFSYGSGALASMYRLCVRDPDNRRFQLQSIASNLKLTERLEARQEVQPCELDRALEARARMHLAGAPYSPVYPTHGRLFPGTYYLDGVDSDWRRIYRRVSLNALLEPHEKSLEPRLELQKPVSQTGPRFRFIEDINAEQYRETRCRIASIVTGTSAGLPGGKHVFQNKNLDRLVEGKQCITPVSGTVKLAMLEKNAVQVKKLQGEIIKRVPIDNETEVVKLAGQLGELSLTASYGVPKALAESMDVATQVAVAAGMEALKSAGLVSGLSNDPDDWMLPEEYRDTTGVIYASSFPALDAAVGEVMRFLQSKTIDSADSIRLVAALRSRMKRALPDKQLSDEDEASFARLLNRAHEAEGDGAAQKVYEYNRKFLFRVLVLANSQLAQLAGCRGPNTQTNAACAGTTQAIAMAHDMLISGRAERVVVMAGDNASGPTLIPWVGSGFRSLGVASVESIVEKAACPFDKRRSGMILGAGGVGMVLETETSAIERLKFSPISFETRARLLHTQYSNSAYHGVALDRKHIASELKRFLKGVEFIHNISKAEIATHGVYFSHETCTHASAASSCAGNEVAALRDAFGDDLLSKMLIVNIKGFTGHAMGVSFEDVAAVEVLVKQKVPPIPNFVEEDDNLGKLNLSKGGPYACRYALRFAAGFGSQVVFALYATAKHG